MAHEDAHGHAAAGERPYFPAEEWEQFRRADLMAAKFIVIEMGGIFAIGLVLYAIIASIIAGAPQ